MIGSTLDAFHDIKRLAPYARFVDQQAQNTAGQTWVTTGWETIRLNTKEQADPGFTDGVSIDGSNNITLPQGLYRGACALAGGANIRFGAGRCFRVTKTSDNSNIAYGIPSMSHSTSAVNKIYNGTNWIYYAVASFTFALAAQTQFYLETWLDSGGGNAPAMNRASEVERFNIIEFQQVSPKGT